MNDELREGEAGALQIGPTDKGMVRFIITTPSGTHEFDFPPEEAEDIAQEVMAAADAARRGRKSRRG